MYNFIDDKKILSILENTKNANELEIKTIIEKAKRCEGLSVEETAILINCEDERLINKIYDVAGYIKNKIYGNRIVMRNNFV